MKQIVSIAVHESTKREPFERVWNTSYEHEVRDTNDCMSGSCGALTPRGLSPPPPNETNLTSIFRWLKREVVAILRIPHGNGMGP